MQPFHLLSDFAHGGVDNRHPSSQLEVFAGVLAAHKGVCADVGLGIDELLESLGH